MSIVKKTIGNSIYQYKVTWDKTKKKQVWEYIGKISTNVKSDIGKQFTNAEINQIRVAYQLCTRNRLGKPRDAIKLLCDRMNIKL